jgi:hypothetical protein
VSKRNEKGEISLFDPTTLLGRLPDQQKYPKTTVTNKKPVVKNTTSSGGSLSVTGSGKPITFRGFTGISTDSFGTSILSGKTGIETANVINSANLWKAEHNKDTNIDLLIQGTQTERNKQDYVDKVIEKTEKISFLATESNEKKENKVTSTGLSIEPTKKPMTSVMNNISTTNNISFIPNTNKNTNTIITNNNISFTNTNNLGISSNNGDLISFDDKNKLDSNKNISSGVVSNNSCNDIFVGVSEVLKQIGGISTGIVTGSSNLNNTMSNNEGNNTKKITIQTKKPVIAEKEPIKQIKSTPFDEEVQLDPNISINDNVNFNTNIDFGFGVKPTNPIPLNTNPVIKPKVINDDEFSIYDDSDINNPSNNANQNNFIKRGGDPNQASLNNLQGAKKGTFIVNHDVPDYSNIKSKIDTTTKVNKDILEEEDTANEELSKKYQQIQKDKQDKLKAYRDMIVKMKNDKRTDQKIKVDKNNFRMLVMLKL